MITCERNRLGIRIVDLNPVRKITVLICEDGIVCRHKLGDLRKTECGGRGEEGKPEGEPAPAGNVSELGHVDWAGEGRRGQECRAIVGSLETVPSSKTIFNGMLEWGARLGAGLGRTGNFACAARRPAEWN